MDGISIITSAWKSQAFLKEYLDSIQNQTYFKDHNNFEILLGIDNCNETIGEILRIATNYQNLNLRVFFFPKHVGTYVIRNTLVDKAKYDYLLFFDSDDIMKENLVRETMYIRTKDNVVRYFFDVFFYYIPPTVWHKQASHGVYACYKDLFLEYGGYVDRFVSADTELKIRMLKFGVKEVNPEGDMFLRRRHRDSLMSTHTDFAERGGMLIEYKDSPKQINRITAKCREIQINEV